MKQKRKILILILFLLLTGCGCTYAIYQIQPPRGNDVVTFNRIAKEAALHWENPKEGNYGNQKLPFSILDRTGEVKYQSSPEAETSLALALEKGNPIMEVQREEIVCGKIIFTTDTSKGMEEYRNRLVGLVIVMLVLFALGAVLYYFYLDYRILKPFQKLEKFAGEISKGNFDFPLQMEKSNLFGAFTESFDLMREELRLSKEKEFLSNQNKKELVASLSHDIKTPITSIKLTSELLLAITEEERLQTKINTIFQKADQIDQLVTNLFHATLEDMEELQAFPIEMYSNQLICMIREADYKEKIAKLEIPECLLLMDKLRTTQIISNVIHNSYKYADTEITVKAVFTDTHLKLQFHDFGNGVSEDDLPLLFNKFYRGKNAAGESGSGLGLYICKKLVNQMYGEIYCENREDGFTVTMLLKLV